MCSPLSFDTGVVLCDGFSWHGPCAQWKPQWSDKVESIDSMLDAGHRRITLDHLLDEYVERIRAPAAELVVDSTAPVIQLVQAGGARQGLRGPHEIDLAQSCLICCKNGRGKYLLH